MNAQMQDMVGRGPSLDERVLEKLQELQTYIRREIGKVRKERDARDYQHGFGEYTKADSDVWGVRVESCKSMEGRYQLELNALDMLRSELQVKMEEEQKEEARRPMRLTGESRYHHHLDAAMPAQQVSENLTVVRADLKSAQELCQTFLMQEGSAKIIGEQRVLLQNQDLAIRMMVAAMEEVRTY